MVENFDFCLNSKQTIQKLNGETSDLLIKILVLFFIISNKKSNETSSLYIIIQQIGWLQ